ncbi:MAG TPA: sigma factor-like helix-turn-helix DNA-binding protein, partial [Candidatus Kapabacteria bacterium]|nr:sigma factor-like helix-turn-helix DNA-binding protein [Candidatus Kapabacteria bacterium]
MDYEAQRALLLGPLRREYPHDPPEWLEDAVSDALDFTIPPAGLTAEQEYHYYLQSARRLLYREVRFHQHEPLLDPKMDAVDKSILDDQLNDETREFIEWGLNQLSQRTANIIRQKRFEKIPLRLVAKEIGMKTKSVQSIYTRGMKKLREILSRELNMGGGGGAKRGV